MSRSTIITCFLSAALGGIVVLAWQQSGSLWQAQAQDSLFPSPVVPVPQQQPAMKPQPARPAAGERPIRPERGPSLNPALRSNEPVPAAEGWDDLTPEERVNVAVYDKCNRSVVNIATKTSKQELIFLEVPAEGSGSGSVLDQQGHILTNYHVIEGAQETRVTLFNGETYDAGLVGYDNVNDIAVLKINAPQEFLVPMAIGNSSKLRVGQYVYALGNPFGLERTLTTGIISSLNRSLPSRSGRTMKSIIQVDAALNRGNSGGPLLDSKGRLIGMNTAIASATGENTGVGFSIPVDTIKRVVPQLISSGRVARPDCGITRVYQTDSGLLIATMTPGGPAERAGLKGFKVVKESKRRGPFLVEEKRIDRNEADMIISVNSEKITTADEFLSQIEKNRPGDEVVIGIIRQGQPMSVSVVLAAGE
jgi:S1-C subfamily serine protease